MKVEIEIGKKSLIWLAVFLLVGLASGYSYTNTGMRAPWFATEDETFNTSSAIVNITNALGVPPNASLPLSALNRSEQIVYSANDSNISVKVQSNRSYSIDLVSTSGVSVVSTSGSYIGDNTQNRAILHNLGTEPATVQLFEEPTGSLNYFVSIDKTHFYDAAFVSVRTVTAWNTTHFFVGTATPFSTNIASRQYNWTATR